MDGTVGRAPSSIGARIRQTLTLVGVLVALGATLPAPSQAGTHVYGFYSEGTNPNRPSCNLTTYTFVWTNVLTWSATGSCTHYLDQIFLRSTVWDTTGEAFRIYGAPDYRCQYPSPCNTPFTVGGNEHPTTAGVYTVKTIVELTTAVADQWAQPLFGAPSPVTDGVLPPPVCTVNPRLGRASIRCTIYERVLVL